MSVLAHLAKNHVAPLARLFGMEYRIICGSGLQHPDQDSRLIGRQLVGSGVEVGFGCCLNAVGLVAEVYGVGIHGEKLLLVVAYLELGGYYPLLAFQDKHTQSGDCAEQSGRVVGAHSEHILCQLLRDG